MLAESVDNEMLKFPLRILVYGTLIFVVPTLALVSLVFIICPVDLAVKFLLSRYVCHRDAFKSESGGI